MARFFYFVIAKLFLGKKMEDNADLKNTEVSETQEHGQKQNAYVQGILSENEKLKSTNKELIEKRAALKNLASEIGSKLNISPDDKDFFNTLKQKIGDLQNSNTTQKKETSAQVNEEVEKYRSNYKAIAEDFQAYKSDVEKKLAEKDQKLLNVTLKNDVLACCSKYRVNSDCMDYLAREIYDMAKLEDGQVVFKDAENKLLLKNGIPKTIDDIIGEKREKALKIGTSSIFDLKVQASGSSEGVTTGAGGSGNGEITVGDMH